jgi:hypothetical protein
VSKTLGYYSAGTEVEHGINLVEPVTAGPLLSRRFLPATYVMPHIFLSIFLSFSILIDK